MMKGLSVCQKLGTLLLCIALCVVVGCGGSKVSKANYDKVKNDMTETQVKEILGEPTESANVNAASKSKTLVWKSGNEAISVSFLNDKVIMKVSSYDLPGK